MLHFYYTMLRVNLLADRKYPTDLRCLLHTRDNILLVQYNIKNSPVQDWRLTPAYCQLQSHVTQK